MVPIKKKNNNRKNNNFWRIAWTAAFRAKIPYKKFKGKDIIDYKDIQENIFISPQFRHPKGINALRKHLPMFDWKIKPIVETHGIVNFRRYWFGHNKTYRHYVSDFLTEYRYCLAFRHQNRGARIWYRPNMIGQEMKIWDWEPKPETMPYLKNAQIEQISKNQWKVIQPLQLNYSRWSKVSKISEKYGTYKHQSRIDYELYFHELQKEHKKRILGF